MTFKLCKSTQFVSTTSEPPTETRNYFSVGNPDPAFVTAYALGATPRIVNTVFGVLYRQDVRLKQTSYNRFDISIPYGKNPTDTGEWTWDFDTTGGTVHITSGKEETGRFPADTAPEQKAVIGADGDSISGTDIVIPAMKINVNYRHPAGDITLSQAKYLASITGRVNNTRFLTFDPGEVLFLGSRGSDGTDVDASVNYQFAMSANADGLTIGDIAGVAKKGWDAIWIRYEDNVEDVAGNEHATRKPEFVYTVRLYDEIDLGFALGFGGF